MTDRNGNFRSSITLTEVIWQTVNRGRLTPEQLQDEIDYSASALKRAGIDGESGAGFNLRKLLPLMKTQDDFSILEFLAYRSGKLLLDIPRGGKSKKARIQSVAEYQKLAAMAVQVLIQFIENGASPKEAEDILYRMLKGTAEMMQDVKTGNQIELDFDGGKVSRKVSSKAKSPGK